MYQFQVRQVTNECFSALGRIRDLNPNNMPMPDVLHAKLRQSIDNMKAKAAEAGMPREDVYDITYAMVAHADEIALNSSGNIHNYWMQQPLQLHYFHETAAGEGFFTRLQAVRSDPNRLEVLRVFYLCLLFGFQGSHRIRGNEIALMNLTEEIRHEITRMDPPAEYLSPRGYRPQETVMGKGRGFPVVFVGFSTLFVAIFAYFSFQSILVGELADLNKKVEVLMGTGEAPEPEATKPTQAAPSQAPPVPAEPIPGSEFGTEVRK